MIAPTVQEHVVTLNELEAESFCENGVSRWRRFLKVEAVENEAHDEHEAHDAFHVHIVHRLLRH